MYHACEATNLEVTLDLRTNLGVPWTLHTWLQTLTTANDNNLVAIINEILQVNLAFIYTVLIGYSDWPPSRGFRSL